MPASLESLLDHFQVTYPSGSSSLVEFLDDLPGRQPTIIFTVYQQWCKEWADIQRTGVTVARPVLVIDPEAGYDTLSAWIATTFSHGAMSDASYFSWYLPVQDDALPESFETLARVFGIELFSLQESEFNNYIGILRGMNDDLAHRLQLRFESLPASERQWFLKNCLTLFVRQVEDLCPVVHKGDSILVDARVGGAVLVTRMLTEALLDIDRKGTANTNHKLAEILRASHYGGCFHELLNACEHLLVG